jgi:isopenicillin-N epimerase
MRRRWSLDPEIVFLNHGSFGACPTEILALQSELRARMERNPIHFFLRELEPMIDRARADVAAFVGCDAEDLVFVRNATTGVSAVLRSLVLSPGDELLTTDHAYAACANALEHVALRSGAKIVVAAIPFPLASEAQVIEPIVRAVTPRTKLAMIDHVTSPTGLVLPIAKIVRALSGIDVLIDGAHAPGMVELDVASIGAAYYTANLHKWPCAPKGAAILWARADKQEGLDPPVISHGYRSTRPRKRLHEQFDWTGTDDPTPWLCAPAAIDAIARDGGGWPAVRERNRALVSWARDGLCEALAIERPAPDDMIGSLAAVPLPDGDAMALQNALFTDHHIEVPIPPWPAPPSRLIRVSAHLHNREEDYLALIAALRDVLSR